MTLMICEFQAADLYEPLQKTFLNWKLSEIFLKKPRILYRILMFVSLPGNLLPEVCKVTYISSKIEKLKAVIDS